MGEARRFLRLFRVELDDLMEDVQHRMDLTERRFEREEITQYVRLANEAILKRELDSLEKFAGIVDGIDASLYKGISAIETALLDRSRDYVSRLEDPEAVYVLLKRKIDKVKAFISSGDIAPASH